MLALAGLFASEDLMHSPGMTFRLTSVSAIRKAVHTGLPATAFGTELGKVGWLLGPNHCVHMSRAAEVPGSTDVILRT